MGAMNLILAAFVVEFPGFFGPNGGLGSKEVPRKFEEMFKKIDIFLHKMVKKLFIIFFLLLQLEEMQLRLKSAEFSKTAFHRIRKKNDETG